MEIKLLCVYGKKVEIRKLQDDENEELGPPNVKKFTRFTAEREELTFAK